MFSASANWKSFSVSALVLSSDSSSGSFGLSKRLVKSRSRKARRDSSTFRVPCWTRISGTMPLFWIERPSGVKYSAVVSFSAPWSIIGRMVWTDPLPKLVVPMTTPRRMSCTAPATISLALALPSLIRTTKGTSSKLKSLGCARNSMVCSGSRGVVETTTPSSTNKLTTSTAAFSTPPGLLRKSRMTPSIGCSSLSLFSLSSASGPVLS